MDIYMKTKAVDLIENKEVASILDWYNELYSYQILQSDNGFTRLDLQTGDIQEIDIEEMVRYYILEIEGKLYYEPSDKLKNELEILKKYIEK